MVGSEDMTTVSICPIVPLHLYKTRVIVTLTHFFRKNLHCTAYVQGGERERFNPLSGARYERSETHDANKQDDSQIASTSKSAGKDTHKPKRGRPRFFNNEERSKWKGKGRENSPYQRNVKETSVKTVEVNAKSKDKS